MQRPRGYRHGTWRIQTPDHRTFLWVLPSGQPATGQRSRSQDGDRGGGERNKCNQLHLHLFSIIQLFVQLLVFELHMYFPETHFPAKNQYQIYTIRDTQTEVSRLEQKSSSVCMFSKQVETLC